MGLKTFNHRATMKLYARYTTDKKAITVNRAIRSITEQIGAHNIISIQVITELNFPTQLQLKPAMIYNGTTVIRTKVAKAVKMKG